MKPVKKTVERKPRKTAKKRSSTGETHRLIRGAKAHFLKTRKLNHGYLKPYKKMLVDLILSQENLDKGLSVANQIFLALEDFDHHVALEGHSFRYQRTHAEEAIIKKGAKEYLKLWGPDRCTIVNVGDIPIGITLYEEGKVIDVRYVDGDYLPLDHPKVIKYATRQHSWTTTQLCPSSKFVLFAYSPIYRVNWKHQWQIPEKADLKRFGHKVAKELNEHAIKLELLQTIAEADEKKERFEWEERQRKWDIEEESRKQRKAIEESTKQLYTIIDQWAENRKLHDFFNQLEKEVKHEPSDQLTQAALKERISKARELVGTVNPLEKLAEWQTPEEIKTNS
jgi:hypothetical protein